jgi:hypothetical protein
METHISSLDLIISSRETTKLFLTTSERTIRRCSGVPHHESKDLREKNEVQLEPTGPEGETNAIKRLDHFIPINLNGFERDPSTLYPAPKRRR